MGTDEERAIESIERGPEAMHLRAACAALGIRQGATLRKWMLRMEPPVKPVRHGDDWRYWMITAEDVERIRARRAQMPNPYKPPRVRPMPILPSVPAFTPRPSPATTRPLSRQIATTARHSAKLPKLPEGATTFRKMIADYGADERTVRKWITGGEVPAPTTEGGPWYAGTTVERIYTKEQIPATRVALERLMRRGST